VALQHLINDVEAAIEKLRRLADDQGTAELPPLEAQQRIPALRDRATQALIAGLVREIAPRHVIEFGCGPATELLARLGLEHGRMAVTTFEHDPWVASEIIAAANPLAVNYRWFSFCICPLVARRCGEALVPVYDDRMVLPTVPHPADLIVVSGPPRALGGRGGMLYQALKYSRSGTIVLLLDVRAEEDSSVEAWVRDLAGHLVFVPPGLLQRHLAFVVVEPLREPFALERPLMQVFAASMQAEPD
jgi:hypothetical protein